MDFISKFEHWQLVLLYVLIGAGCVFLFRRLTQLIRWAKKRPAGAYLVLALFPLISLLPIPPAEIKKLQRVKQEQVKRQQESGDKAVDEQPTPK